ncbi:MAG: 3-oxoacyl-ACP synthase, partial [Parvibaculum sp.]
MSKIRTIIAGTGSYLPARVMTNDDLSKIVDTTDEWIVERTGIHRRHIAADGELTSHLALAAARAAIADAGIDAQEIDTIILATTTPDNTFPATAVT